MKRLIYVLVALLLLILLVALGGIIYLNTGFPQVAAAEDITIEVTPAMLERGEYLANHVSVCMDCHSNRNYKMFATPVIPGTEGKGGELFKGIPGTLYNANITPAALGDWTDGELVRAITCGVDREDKPLAPMMPYLEYRYLATEDVHSIVAYLRTLQPLESEVPEPEFDFPLNLIFRTIPRDAEPQALPDPSDSLATGKYLARVAGCFFCHTPAEQGTPVPGKDFAGGHEFPDPGVGTIRSSNITPDVATGIGGWSKALFIARFKAYADSAGRNIPMAEAEYPTIMPWTLYAGMTEEDLGAIYAYLQTVRPVVNAVKKFSPEL